MIPAPRFYLQADVLHTGAELILSNRGYLGGSDVGSVVSRSSTGGG